MERVSTFQGAQPGDVFFSVNPRAVGRAIRHFTRREDLLDLAGRPMRPAASPNHAGVVYGQEGGRLCAVEALASVELTDFSAYFQEWQAGGLYIFRPPAGQGLSQDLAWLRAQVGARYGWGQVVWAAVQQRARQWLGLELPVLGRRGFICSELAFLFLRRRYMATQDHRLEWTLYVGDQNGVYPAWLMAACQADALPASP